MLKDIAAIVFTPAFAFSVLRIATPVLFAALGGIFASRAGIFNMALEGMMLISALTGVVVSAKVKMGILGGLKFGMDGYAELIGKAEGMGALAGFLSGVLAAVLVGLFMAFMGIKLKANMYLTGLALNTIASGGTVFVLYLAAGEKGVSLSLASSTMPIINIPIIKDIPVIGQIISGHNIMVYLAIISIFIVYILIDKHRSYEDKSYIVISEIFDLCGYKLGKNKPKVFYEIIKCLLFLNESNMIRITSNFDIYAVRYTDCIQMDIISSNFDATDKFSKITSSQLDFIMMSESSINKENILMAFLYINSYIFIRPKNKNNEEIISDPKSKPEAFFRSMESMAKELAISKDTLNQCIQCLISSSENQKPLLIKREVGSIQPDPKKPPQNVPNIYVLNKEGYEQEIEWAILKMLEVYNVDSFGELIGKDVK